MKVLHRIGEARAWAAAFRAAGLSIGFVPTMGALHRGHASLIERARGECDRVAVSIFVNPTQFGPGEDLARYPRTPEADLEVCSRAGADVVYFGDATEILPPGFQTWVQVAELERPLCGASRPGHFRGVATVVTQLLQILSPHRAYFGLKDFQQCRVIERMVRDLHIPVEVRLVETAREEDGLALSSRNAYLSPAARARAPALHRALEAGRASIEAGERSVEALRAAMLEALGGGPGIALEYLDVREAATLLEPAGGRLAADGRGVLLAIAARLEGARLIDNVWIP